MNSERRDRCSWDRSAAGSGISTSSEYSLRAEVVEYYRNRKGRGCQMVNSLNSFDSGH